MTKKNMVSAVLFLALSLAGVWLAFSRVESFRNARRLKASLTALPQGTTTLEEAVPFDWEAVYSFEPYTSREEIARNIGFDSPEIAETIGEGGYPADFCPGGQGGAVCLCLPGKSWLRC